MQRGGRSLYDLCHEAEVVIEEVIPGDGAAHSDSGYILLGLIIEKVSDMRYSEFLERRAFSPFDMSTTSILDRRVIVKNYVSCYMLHDGKVKHERRVWRREPVGIFH